ncbi:NAD(P)/FAD-dependent oxidoreductase [Chamaesiphon minutus]|uniref:NADH:ubiquinone reductase (non-electrogenic) n=1 Tax=Chamaesiphon minutus (strain ATCC 27169 / PCC 6605) TaxID=1173020 RepID=K9UF90_CHAP6|nr:NAD(P)/FAD-dependent oxidoreductase [Chamaesiphon minutus]AFY93500.1 NADH dehydrogenase, FAD-containing subunit [Chamaesiphon minutus PCC 6605]
MMQKFPIAIVGAGFGGLQAAQSLAHCGKEILLIDRVNYHTFVPLLYQVATAQLEPEQIVYPVRTILRRSRRCHFLMAEVEKIDLSARIITTDRIEINYDFLVLATGSKSQYLGVPGAKEYAFSVNSLPDAVALRDRLLECLEAASIEADPLRREQLLTFVIIGGGATGTEVSGALVELFRSRIRHEYPTLNLHHVKLILVQSGDRLLSELSPKLGIYTQKYLHKLGVDIRFSTQVARITTEAVYLHDRQIIPTKTAIWTAGVEATMPELSEDWSRGQKNKLRVRPTLQSIEYDNVYAIGDVAYIDRDGKGSSGVAPEALQQGVTVARNITSQLQNRQTQPFRYFNKGRLAIIGCRSGVGDIQGWTFTGLLAWLIWLGVHLVYLPGFRNRLLVLLTWLQTYLGNDRVVRSILPLQPRTDFQHKSILKQKLPVGATGNNADFS